MTIEDKSLVKTFDIPLASIGYLEYLLSVNGFSSPKVYIDEQTLKPIVRFENAEEYSVFLLKGLDSKVSRKPYQYEMPLYFSDSRMGIDYYPINPKIKKIKGA